MTALSDAGVNKWHIQRMVGKKLSQDISTYLLGVDLKADFARAESKMKLTGISNGNGYSLLEFLKETVTNLQGEVEKQKLIIQTLSENRIKETSQLKEEVASLILSLAKLVKEKNISLSDALVLLIKESKELRLWNPEKESKPLIEVLKEKLEMK